MFGQHFYHKQIRNTVIAFGTIFNNINIRRLDSSGNPLQNIRVPLSYSPREKFLARLEQQADLTGDDSSVAITLPRMSFDITGYSYDPARKLNKNQKLSNVKTTGDTTKLNTQFSPVPYNVSISLNVFTSNSDDGLQIIEQILPYFQPDYTVTMFENKEFMDSKRDIPFILNSVDYDDTYTGSLTTNRRIIYTLSFTAKIYLYGPISTSSIIKKVSADLYTDLQGKNPSRNERVTVTPNPTSADKDDTYTYTETLSFFNDGLNYDESTGEDK